MNFTFKPGWADALAKDAGSKDEKTRAEALGYQPRRCFRIDRARQAESARRGNRRSHAIAARKPEAAEEEPK